MPTPNDTSSESSRRDVSHADLCWHRHCLNCGDISTTENRADLHRLRTSASFVNDAVIVAVFSGPCFYFCETDLPGTLIHVLGSQKLVAVLKGLRLILVQN